MALYDFIYLPIDNLKIAEVLKYMIIFMVSALFIELYKGRIYIILTQQRSSIFYEREREGVFFLSLARDTRRLFYFLLI